MFQPVLQESHVKWSCEHYRISITVEEIRQQEAHVLVWDCKFRRKKRQAVELHTQLLNKWNPASSSTFLVAASYIVNYTVNTLAASCIFRKNGCKGTVNRPEFKVSFIPPAREWRMGSECGQPAGTFWSSFQTDLGLT